MKRGLGLIIVFLIVLGSALFVSTQGHGNLYQQLGWQVKQPAGWVADGASIKDPASDKRVLITAKETSPQDVVSWVNNEAQQTTQLQPVNKMQRNGLEVYLLTSSEVAGKCFSGPVYLGDRTVLSFNPIYLEDRQIEVRKALFFDGRKQVLFASQGPVSESEFTQLIDSFELKAVKKPLTATEVKEVSIFAPGAPTKIITRKKDSALIEELVSAYNDAGIFRQEAGKAYPVVLTLTLKDGSEIEISGGAFDFQTVRQDNREFNVQGAKLQEFFVQ